MAKRSSPPPTSAVRPEDILLENQRFIAAAHGILADETAALSARIDQIIANQGVIITNQNTIITLLRHLVGEDQPSAPPETTTALPKKGRA